MIEVRGLTKHHGRKPVLSDVAFSLSRGEIIAVVGPSGCGKSTLLRILAGADRDYRGIVQVDAESPYHHARNNDVGFLKQDGILLPWRSALDNVLLPIDLIRRRTSIDEYNARSTLSALGLSKDCARRPHELSSGMRQRVGIAQAMILDPDLILLDEPFSSVDEHLRWQLVRHMKSCLKAKAAVWVTHSVQEAIVVGTKIAICATGDQGTRLEIRENTASIGFKSNGLPDLEAIGGAAADLLADLVFLNCPDNHTRIERWLPAANCSDS